MIVVMQPDATQDDISNVMERIAEHQLAGHLSQGEARTVIGVVGAPLPPELSSEFESLSGVERTVRITKPYKLVSREFHPHPTRITVGNVVIGGDDLAVIAGPCSVESEDQIMRTAHGVREAGARLLRGGAYKPRTSPYSFRGMGEKGLELLARAREATGLPVVTEVMTPRDVPVVSSYADVLQIGARNMQNYLLLEEVGRVDKAVMIKRGHGATIEEWLLAAEYVMAQGNPNVILCERGIRTFETATRNTLDLNAVAYAKRVTHLPVITDPSHGTGKWQLVPPLSLASVACGADGLLLEVHCDPDRALSDGSQSLNIPNFAALMEQLATVAHAVGRGTGAQVVS
jgi:3-deoxy-7-phosphoheptulonate synthase